MPSACAIATAKPKQASLLIATAVSAPLLLIVASPALGQAAASPPSVSEEPGPKQGVIKPPPTGDADIETTAPDPNAGSEEEVIPPPGTPGGNPNIEPR